MLVLKKENSVVTEFNSIRDALIKSDYHLCADCKNLNPLICSKVEIEKEEIGEYDYITDGYQVYLEDGYLETFVVTGCKNFVCERRVEKDLNPRGRTRKK